MVGPSARTRTRKRSTGDPISRLLLLGQRRLRLAWLRDHLGSSLWFVPALAVSTAAALSMSTTTIDEHLHIADALSLGFELDAEGARGILSLISSWMLTFIGLAFSMTIVVLQLASAQFSPRVMGTLLRDRYSQLTMGMFIGTFAYAFMVMRSVRSGIGPEFVPAISLAMAFTLVLVSLGVFIRFVNHVAQSMRAGSVITTVSTTTRHVLDEQFPDRLPRQEIDDWRPYRTVPAPRGGLLRSFDSDGLVALARRSNTALEIVPRVGQFVPAGGPLVRITGDATDIEPSDVVSQISIGQERTMHQDPEFGFRQLVDIAERALSPGINDPTTAVQVIDQLHDLLRDLLLRRFPIGTHADADGIVRLVVPQASWDDFLLLAVEEIRHYGADSLQVSRRLRHMLLDLLEAAPPAQQAAITRELGRLHEVAEQHFPDHAHPGDRDT